METPARVGVIQSPEMIVHQYLRQPKRLAANLAASGVSPKNEALGEPDWDARAREVLRAFFMPTRYSSPETRAAAEIAARELGAPLVTTDIDAAFTRELEAVAAMLQPGESVDGPTRQNVQARIRAERMWSWANSAWGSSSRRPT